MDNDKKKTDMEVEYLKNEYAGLIKDNQDPKNYFKKKKYDDYFEMYCQQHNEIFEHIQKYFDKLESEISESETNSSIKKDFVIQQLANAITEAAKIDVEKFKGLNKGNRQGELNLFMVTSVFPCNLKLGGQNGELLCEEIIKEWEKAFPGTKLGYADFEKLKSGFKSFWGFFTGR